MSDKLINTSQKREDLRSIEDYRDAWETVDMESESTGNSDGRVPLPLQPPPDSPVQVVESFEEEFDRSNEDFRTSFTSSIEGVLSVQLVPPSLSTPATHLPTFEERFLQLQDPQAQFSHAPEQLDLALLEAVRSGSETDCQQILDLQLHPEAANPNYQDETGKAALHCAAERGLVRICTLLVDFGEKTDVNLPDFHGRTPLHYATTSGQTEVVQFLLRCGADPSLHDEEGNSPLHYAARQDDDIIMSCFLRRSPSVHAKNAMGMSPIDLAGPKTAPLLLAAQKKRRATGVKSTQRGEGGQDEPFNRIPIEESSQEEVNKLMGRLSSESKPDGKTSVSQLKCGPEDFDLLQQLGKGSFGEVYLVKKKADQRLFAMKVLRKDKIMGQNLVKYAMTERNVLSYIRHPFIVSLNSAFQTADRLFLILDYCPGGDMGWHLSKEKRFNEYRARIYASEVLLALEELHGRGIIFRDLKPDNVVFDAEGHAMLTDFGLSKEGVYNNESAKSFCGSVAYLAPEMLKRQGHGKAVDWYLLGVLIYEMLVGTPPYFSRDRDQLFHNIQHGTLRLPKWLSLEAKNIIRALLERNPQKRLGSGPRGSEEIKMFGFFKGINWEVAVKRELRPPVLPKPVVFPAGVPREKVYGKGSQLMNPESYLEGWSFVSHS